MWYSNSSNGAVAPTAENGRFRILCRRADGSVGLVRLCNRLSEACRIARLLVNRHLTKLRNDSASVLLDSDRPREVYVERWTGILVEGQWAIVDRSEGGYRFEFFDRRPRTVKSGRLVPEGSIGKAADSPANSELNGRVPRAGDIVQGVLLEKRTRKNGWFARLVDQSASGPVTGVAPSTMHLEPGQQVQLKLCGIKLETGFVQFAWVPNLEK